MAGSSPARRRKSRRRIYTALLLTVIIVVGVYFLYFSPGPPIVVDFTFQMSIQISIQAPNGTKVSFLGQDTPVGVAGYPWHNHTYDGQELSSTMLPIILFIRSRILTRTPAILLFMSRRQ